MKLNEFINKYLNKKIDFDGVYGYQCVDVFRQYCKEVLNCPHTGGVIGAKDLFLRHQYQSVQQKYFDRLNVTHTMLAGDTIIWDGNKNNKYGHVAIFLGYVDTDKFLVFEQDGIKQQGCKIEIRSIENCLGVLRFKKEGE